MKVFIDGMEYVPKDEKFVEVHGIKYESVPNWLMNIHGSLVSEWVNSVKKNGGHPDNGNKALRDRIYEFEMLCSEYLGFETRKGEIGFFEKEEQ